MVRTVEVWYSPDVWKKPIWYVLTISSDFADGVANLEKINVCDTLFEPGICEPGLDNFESLFNTILEKMK